MKGITRCKLTIISESAWTDCILPGQSIDFYLSFIMMQYFYFVFVYINECIDVNTAFKEIPSNL